MAEMELGQDELYSFLGCCARSDWIPGSLSGSLYGPEPGQDELPTPRNCPGNEPSTVPMTALAQSWWGLEAAATVTCVMSCIQPPHIECSWMSSTDSFVLSQGQCSERFLFTTRATCLRSFTNSLICECLDSSSGARRIEDGCTVAITCGARRDSISFPR